MGSVFFQSSPNESKSWTRDDFGSLQRLKVSRNVGRIASDCLGSVKFTPWVVNVDAKRPEVGTPIFVGRKKPVRLEAQVMDVPNNVRDHCVVGWGGRVKAPRGLTQLPSRRL